MSDFLDQFTNKNYRKNEVEDTAAGPEIEAADLTEREKEPEKEPEKEISSVHRVTGLKSTEHEVVIDTTYNKHKTIRIVSICATILLLCAGGRSEERRVGK